MAYTLKSSGLALKAVAVIAVDEDGTTVKDFVGSNSVTHNASITAPVTGTATWKSVSRGWFKTDQGADAFSPRGVSWNATKPVVNGGSGSSGWAFWCATSSLVDATGGFILEMSSESHSLKRDGSGKIVNRTASTDQTASTTSVGASTKLSFGVNFLYGNTNNYFYGLESGSLATDGSYTDAGFGSDGLDLDLFGGVSGNGVFRGNHHIMCMFNQPLTTLEMQSLHDDWFGTLFDGGGGGGDTNARLLGGDLLQSLLFGRLVN